ncbi:MAG: hypothetical protein ACO24Y_01620 [Hylemonella sp.]
MVATANTSLVLDVFSGAMVLVGLSALTMTGFLGGVTGEAFLATATLLATGAFLGGVAFLATDTFLAAGAFWVAVTFLATVFLATDFAGALAGFLDF